jgi:hypothetical protein
MHKPIQQTTGDHSNPADAVKPSPPADASPNPGTPGTASKEPIAPTPAKKASGSRHNSIFRKAK